MRALRAAVMIAAILVLTPSVVGAVSMMPPDPTDILPGGSSTGGGSGSSRSFLSYVTQRTNLIDTNNSTQVRNAVSDVDASARANLTSLSSGLYNNRTTIASYAHAAFVQAHGANSTWKGYRTNLTVARGPTGLAEATLALMREMGNPATPSQEVDIRQRAALVPTSVGSAAAVATYAAIDSHHYLAKAFKDVDRASYDRLQDNGYLLELLHRRIEHAINANGTAVVAFAPETEQALRDAQNVTATLDLQALAQAIDVIAQATDEIKGMSLPANVPESQSASTCADQPLVFASFSCELLIGGNSGVTYKHMRGGTNGEFELNVVLLDLGGDDTYQHRAGGGRGRLGCTTCQFDVQINLDLGTGNDKYLRNPVLYNTDGSAKTCAPCLGGTAPVLGGPVQGAGGTGVGLLYDAGGNDIYQATHPFGASNRLVGVLAQGAASLGGGLLVDEGGNDQYWTHQYGSTDLAPTHAQGYGALGGLGVLRDLSGGDSYVFNASYWLRSRLPDGETFPVDSGGGQGSATTGGIGILADYGAGNDAYRAGQDLVQGAATASGFALLHDQGGANTFTLESSRGCPILHAGESCEARSVTPRPIAGWARGYANTNGYAALLAGAGNDVYSVQSYPEGATNDYEGLHTHGAGSDGGVGVFHDQGGADTYQARDRSFGYGSGAASPDPAAAELTKGVGIFSDTGGVDTYTCTLTDCYGAASSGAGLYYDGISSGDAYSDGNARNTGPWTRGNLGLGWHQESFL